MAVPSALSKRKQQVVSRRIREIIELLYAFILRVSCEPADPERIIILFDEGRRRKPFGLMEQCRGCFEMSSKKAGNLTGREATDLSCRCDSNALNPESIRKSVAFVFSSPTPHW